MATVDAELAREISDAFDNDDCVRVGRLFAKHTSYVERFEFFRIGLAEWLALHYEDKDHDLCQNTCLNTLLEYIATDTEANRKCWYQYLTTVPSTLSSRAHRPFMWYLVQYMDIHDEDTGEYYHAPALFKLLDADIDDMVAKSIRRYRHTPIDNTKSDYHELIAARLLSGSGRLTKGAQRD